MQKLSASLVLICCAISMVSAQPYANHENTRHRFAQLTLGTGIRQASLSGLEPYGSNGSVFEQVFHIGGTHFWGHSEFYIDIPMFGSKVYSQGMETGAKLFPWPLIQGKLRPCFSLAFSVPEFSINGGAVYNDLLFPLGAGLVYLKNGWVFDLSCSFTKRRSFDYYVTQQEQHSFQLANTNFSLGVRKMLETTLSAERSWRDGSTAELTDKLAAAKRLDGFTLAAGPSSTWFLKKSSYNEERHPFLEHQIALAPFADLGIGYYFHTGDWQTNVSWRTFKLKNQAFGFEQEIERTSLGLEAFKFLGDYYGFVPFIGAIMSYEQLGYNDGAVEHKDDGLNGGVTFGWDIRPNRLGVFILRTNLRYYPKLDLNMPNGLKFDLSQIELNFIQLVIFPQRIMGYR